MENYYLFQLVMYVIGFIMTFAATTLGVYVGMKWFTKNNKKEK